MDFTIEISSVNMDIDPSSPDLSCLYLKMVENSKREFYFSLEPTLKDAVGIWNVTVTIKQNNTILF